jgi:phage gp46-like protein
MSDVIIRAAEGCDPDPFLLWDTIPAPIAPYDLSFDWALAGADEPLNRGGLASTRALETAVMLALFTDKRIDPSHPLFFLADGDPRGWWGNALDVRADLGEAELGSHLWLLARAPLTVNGFSAAQWARQFALEALAPLQGQGAVSRIDAQASVNEANARLELTVQLYGRDGTQVYDRKFDLVWKQLS